MLKNDTFSPVRLMTGNIRELAFSKGPIYISLSLALGILPNLPLLQSLMCDNGNIEYLQT